jgi:hypothetical protein
MATVPSTAAYASSLQASGRTTAGWDATGRPKPLDRPNISGDLNGTGDRPTTDYI